MGITIDGSKRRALPCKICPAAVLKIVQLAGSGGVEIPSPGKPLNNNARRQFGFKQGLRRLKPVQRHVMST